MIHRRDFFHLAAGSLAALSVPSLIRADVALGSATLTTLSDGHLVLPGDFVFAEMPQEELATILAAREVSRDRIEPPCNLALYRDGTNTVLFDVGAGPDFQPSAGQLVESLDAAGLAPEDVTHVVFTHAHPDHIWGLLDEFDEPLFADASYLMGRVEWDYWWNPATVDEIGEARAAFAVGAKRRMEVIEDAVELFDDDQEILPGIAAIATFGHTPGHMAFEVRSGSESGFVVGDAIGNHHVALARPDWESGSDQDAAQAVVARMSLLDRIVTAQAPMVGFHLPGGGLGRVERAQNGYSFTPEAS